MTLERKLWLSVAALLFAALATFAAREHTSKKTLAVVIDQRDEAQATAETTTARVFQLVEQVSGLQTTLKEKDLQMQLAMHQIRQGMTVKHADGSSTTTWRTTTDTQQNLVEHALEETKSKVDQLQQQVTDEKTKSATSEAKYQTILTQLHQQDIEVTNSAPRWELDLDADLGLLGNPSSLVRGTDRIRAGAGLVLGSLTVGGTISPMRAVSDTGFNWENLTPMLHLGLRL